jgi:Holliday junction resolvasome RuvABC endonuclease subunit
MSNVIGIDPSITATGLCDHAGRLSVAGGPAYMGDKRLTVIESAVQQLANLARPDLAVIEFLPQHMKAAGITGMVQGVVRNALFKLGVPYVTITPATLKKFATGRGDADKADMRMALYKRTGGDVRSDDMVDAWWLRAAGLQALGEGVVDLPAAQVRALDVVAWPHLAEADAT